MSLRPLRLALALACALPLALFAQSPAPAPAVTILRPARVFDGNTMHEGWAVRVSGGRIEAVGPAASVAAPGAQTRELAGSTLIPGLIEGHSHVLLHPYNETTWNDQVLKESTGLRVARATTAFARRCSPASPRCAISAPRAPATRTSS